MSEPTTAEKNMGYLSVTVFLPFFLAGAACALSWCVFVFGWNEVMDRLCRERRL